MTLVLFKLRLLISENVQEEGRKNTNLSKQKWWNIFVISCKHLTKNYLHEQLLFLKFNSLQEKSQNFSGKWRQQSMIWEKISCINDCMVISNLIISLLPKFLNVPWAKAQKCVLKPLCKNDPQYWDITTSFLWKLCSFFRLKVESGLFFFSFCWVHTKQTLLILKLLPRLHLY